jgi:hypothetical protein
VAQSTGSTALFPILGSLLAAIAIGCVAIFVFCRRRGDKSGLTYSEAAPTRSTEMVTCPDLEPLNLISIYQPDPMDTEGHEELNHFADILAEAF